MQEQLGQEPVGEILGLNIYVTTVAVAALRPFSFKRGDQLAPTVTMLRLLDDGGIGPQPQQPWAYPVEKEKERESPQRPRGTQAARVSFMGSGVEVGATQQQQQQQQQDYAEREEVDDQQYAEQQAHPEDEGSFEIGDANGGQQSPPRQPLHPQLSAHSLMGVGIATNAPRRKSQELLAQQQYQAQYQQQYQTQYQQQYQTQSQQQYQPQYQPQYLLPPSQPPPPQQALQWSGGTLTSSASVAGGDAQAEEIDPVDLQLAAIRVR